ncbi:MAG TPA: hypothetical protein VII61_04470 [Ktedonobacteraceae bacterium]
MTKARPKLPIFRSKTLQKYMENREKSVLPRILAPPVFAFSWLVLTLLIAAGIAVWLGQVPSYITGSGIILDTNSIAKQGDGSMAAILLPANAISSIRPGLPVQVQVGQAGPHLQSVIDGVSQNLLSPDKVRQKYGFEVTDPSLVATVELGSTVSRHLYEGSPIRAQIQIGSQSLLTLFPGVNSLLKGQ